jgi:class 3 adenylate cyclase/tetratricopeptide (TPR) repeat protein
LAVVSTANDRAASLASFLPPLALRTAGSSGIPSDAGASLGIPPAAPHGERVSAAMLFADIVGFTALAESLAGRGSAGAEELSALLNAYFGQLIDVVSAHAGEVYRFAGDALLACWPLVDDAADLGAQTRRAARCAQVVQETLHDYQLAPDVRLSLRVGVGAGEVLAAHVGGVGGRVEFVLAGDPLVQIGAAAGLARPGEVVLSPAARALVPDALVERVPDGDGWRLRRLSSPPSSASRRRPEPPARVADAARAYVPAAVLLRLDAGQTNWIAELRRITTVFIRIGGVRHASADALDQLQAAVRSVQEVLAEYEGTLVQVVVADKGTVAIAVFGLPPLAHDDDAVRAVLAAMALRSKLPEGSSIGLTTGDAFCGPIGNDVRREYNLMGAFVNLGARLMEVGQGGILCDAATAAAARSRLAFAARPPLALKGVGEFAGAYTPLAPRAPAPGPPREHDPLVGRTAERRLLVEALEQLVATGRGGALVVEGEAGIGKSRLVRELVARAESMGVACGVGVADAIDHATPYQAWRPILAELGRLEGVPPPAELAPLLNAVLGTELPETSATAAMTADARADNARELLVRLVEQAAHGRPLLLVLEDAHWLDSASWALARLVHQRVRRLVLAMTLRPLADVVPAGGPLGSADAAPVEYRELLAAPGTRRLELGRLTEAGTDELVRARLGVDRLPEPLARLIRERAEGHPLYSEELAYELRERGIVRVVDGECRLAPDAGDLSAIALPSTLLGVMTSRIDRLPPSQQLTLKVASVIGRAFSSRVLRAVYPAGDQPERVEHDLARLTELDLARLEALEPEPTYLFKHALTQEVAYNLMLFAQRRQLHRAVAEWYERTYAEDPAPVYAQLAFHWTRALRSAREEPAVANTALRYLEQAGRQAIASFANVEAIRLFEQALRLHAELAAGGAPVDPDRAAGWERAIGEAYFRLGRAPRSVDHLRRALALLRVPAPASSPALAGAIARDAAVQVSHHVLPGLFARPLPEPRRRHLVDAAQAYASLSLISFIAMEELASISALLRGHNLAERAGPSGVLLRTSYQISNFAALLFANPKLHEFYFRRALLAARHVDDPASEAEMWFGRGVFLITQARWAEAESATARARTLFEAVGDRRWVELTLYQQSNVAMLQGDFGRAIELAGLAATSATGRGDVQAQAWLLIEEAHARLMLGQHQRALDLLRDADRRLASSYAQLSDPVAQLWSLATRALAHAQRGECAEALEAAERAAALIKPYVNFMYYSIRGLGNLAQASLLLRELLGVRDARARRLARASVRAVRGFTRSSPFGRPQALLARGGSEWLDGRPERARRAWLAGLEEARRLGMPYEEGLARRELGRHPPPSIAYTSVSP